MPRRSAALAAALAVLALAAPAVAGAQGTTAPTAVVTPPPADPASPIADIALRLPDPAWLPARTAGPVAAVTRAEDLVDPLLPPGAPGREDALQRLVTAGLVGGARQDFAGPDGSPSLTAWAVRFADPSGARQGLETLRWALRRRADTTLQTVVELPDPPDARLVVTSDRAGGLRTTALFQLAGWVYALDSAAPPGQQPDPDVGALLARLATRQPDRLDPAGAQPLPVTADLRTALAQARLQARTRRGAPVMPTPGTTQAARLGTTGWALARFAGVSSDPELFRQDGGGPWRAVGDAGGAGCPRVPVEVRRVWGLEDRCPLDPSPVSRPDDPDALAQDDSPFRGLGTWVWELRTSGGVPNVVRQATAFGLRTVFLKSGDGTTYWRQFDGAVAPLKAAGLRVCAWQYVYGRRPVAEARVAARAMRAGADCFVVDAESEFSAPRGPYGGRTYVAARRYMAELRRLVGADAPIALTSFAYVDYHPGFPYSAFLEGPNGADVLMPQIYWGAFRTAVDRAVRRTAQWNSIYGVPIAPIAGTYEREVPRDLVRFRCLAAAYGWPGASYWSFQHTRPDQWPSLGAPVSCGDALLARTYPSLRYRQGGDAVMWLQIRLRAWGLPVPRTGLFRTQTRAAVRAFQRAHGLQPDGVAGPLTWALLLQTPPPRATARR